MLLYKIVSLDGKLEAPKENILTSGSNQYFRVCTGHLFRDRVYRLALFGLSEMITLFKRLFEITTTIIHKY